MFFLQNFDCFEINFVFVFFTVIFLQAGTPYQNGSFRVKLLLGKSFPTQPPKGYFQTKIFHPNVSRNGEICVNTLKKDWNENLGIKHLLLVIKCLLIVPNPESALNEDAAKLLLENYDEYYRRAKMITEIHAKRSIQQQQCFDNRNCNENNDDDDKNVRNDYESTTSGDSSTQSSTANKTKSSSSNNDLMPLTKRPANNLNIINTTNITIDQQQMKNRNLQQSKSSSSSVTQNKHKRTLKRL